MSKVFEDTTDNTIVCWLFDVLYGYLYATTTWGYGGTQTQTAVPTSAIKADGCGRIRYGCIGWIEAQYLTEASIRMLFGYYLIDTVLFLWEIRWQQNKNAERRAKERAGRCYYFPASCQDANVAHQYGRNWETGRNLITSWPSTTYNYIVSN